MEPGVADSCFHTNGIGKQLQGSSMNYLIDIAAGIVGADTQVDMKALLLAAGAAGASCAYLEKISTGRLL